MALVCVCAAVAIGCGGSNTPEVNNPKALLIRAEDLPGGSESGEAPPEFCDPLPVLKQAGGATAISPVFFSSSARVAEAVGIFETPDEAAEAYESLNDPERLNCIKEVILQTSGARTVDFDEPEQLEVGDEGSSVHYSAGAFGTQGSTDVISLKAGSCVVALLVATENTVSTKVAETATDMAGELLVDGCE